MSEFFSQVDWVIAALIFGVAIGAFILSTISGGGGALIQIPVLNYLIGTGITAPVLNLGTLISRPSRLVLFWNDINWKVVGYYAPFAIIGSWLASWVFAEVHIGWVQLIVGAFLVSTVFQYRFGKKDRSFEMKYAYFPPLGILVSAIGTITGGMGPVLNPFFMNAGLEKEELIGTKTANSFVMGLAQLSGYSYFGLLYDELWVYGIVLGLGATVGNIIGKRVLGKMSIKTFRYFLIALMVISGLIMIVKQVNEMFL